MTGATRDDRHVSYECDARGAVELNLLLAKQPDDLPPTPIWPR
jgi:hypothetical protein